MHENDTAQRIDFPVLVLDAHERMSVAVIRSLGRAGYPVHACSMHSHAAGCRSRFVTRRETCPDYSSPDFLQWLRSYCATYKIRCLIPTEPLLLAIRPVFREFTGLLPLSDDEETVYRGINKFDLFRALREDDTTIAGSSGNLPPLILLRRGEDLPSEEDLAKLGLPIFVKVDADYSADGESATYSAASTQVARALVERLLKSSDRLVVQGYIPAIGVGAFVLRARGSTRAELMHVRLHEVPLRGWSSYSKSWRHDGILRDANAKLTRLGWEGVAMMEYRWNPADDKFALIEMNGRFWGSLHLALYSGVDFPSILLDRFRGAEPGALPTAKLDVHCRDPFLEAKYVLSRCRSKNIKITEKIRTIAEYLRLTLDPRVKSASWFPGDRRLVFWQMWQFLVSAARRFTVSEARTAKVERNTVGD